jgi:hypothetical protein
MMMPMSVDRRKVFSLIVGVGTLAVVAFTSSGQEMALASCGSGSLSSPAESLFRNEDQDEALATVIRPIVKGTDRRIPVFLAVVSTDVFDPPSHPVWHDPDQRLLNILKGDIWVRPISDNKRSVRSHSRCYIDIRLTPEQRHDAVKRVDVDYLSIYVTPAGNEQVGGFKKSYYLLKKNDQWVILRIVSRGSQIMT